MNVAGAELQRHLAAAHADDVALVERVLARMPAFVAAADRDGEIDPTLWDGIDVAQLNGFALPVEFGGSPLAATGLRRTMLFERLGAVCPGLSIGLPGPGLSMPPVLSLATPEQKASYFDRFRDAARPVWGAFAITEPDAGSDATAIRTQAIPDGDHYVLNGDKCFITNGARADVIVVFATVDRSRGRFGIRAFAVPRTTPGFSVVRTEDMMGLRVSQLAQLSFAECRVPKESMLGHTGKRGPLIDAFTGAQYAWDYMRPVLTGIINGACAGVLDYAEALWRERGRELLSRSIHAAVGDALPAYRARLRAARLSAYRAATTYDAGGRAALEASMAKAYAATLAAELAACLSAWFPLDAMRAASPLAKFCRDAKAFDILEGTGDMQRLMIARAYEAA